MILPLFSSHYSIGSSILTLEEAGKTKPGNPVSICDIAKRDGLKQVMLVEDRVDGFLEAYKNLSKPFAATPPKTYADYLKHEQGEKKTASDEDKKNAQKSLDEATEKYEREKKWTTEPNQLIYGLRLVVVTDMDDKTENSRRQESQIVIFVNGSQGYNDLIPIWNRAWVAGHYTPPRESGYGRIDWKTLKTMWTPNLSLALPFFSSFLAVNTMTFHSIIPDLPVPASEVTLFREIDSGIPFADLLDEAIDRFAAETGAEIQPVKSIYYETRADFLSYMVYRCDLGSGELSRPDINDFSSDRFSYEDWKRLAGGSS